MCEPPYRGTMGCRAYEIAAGEPAGTPGGLEIVAADAAVEIENLAGEEQAGQPARFVLTAENAESAEKYQQTNKQWVSLRPLR